MLHTYHVDIATPGFQVQGVCRRRRRPKTTTVLPTATTVLANWGRGKRGRIMGITYCGKYPGGKLPIIIPGNIQVIMIGRTQSQNHHV